jgi:inorganic phosphate transporter, PiT family
MDIHTVKKLETKAVESTQPEFLRMGIALAFMLAVLWYSFGADNVTNNAFLAIAAVFGAYMALNIGANDVANNVGPAVGSKALTMGGAIAIAMIFEAGGALIAGGDVVSTIKKGIIDPAMFINSQEFIWAMTAALLAGGIWLNLATSVGAPVSTTHSIVGGVMGGGIAAAGFSIVSWGTMGKIAASWVISPVLGAIIAAIFLYTLKKSIIYQEDRLSAMRKMVPIYVALMAFAFATYLTLKGLKKIWPSIIETANAITPFTFEMAKKPTLLTALSIGFISALIVFFIVKPLVAKASRSLQNTVRDANSLFTIPLIFAAALLSFAHGANDVANAVGPLAAIADAVQSSAIATKASIPLWVMLIGAIGISLGLALYGPKLIRTVGSEITELNQIRAYSVAMAAAITVIIASQLGLPVSSTHIAIGGIFGVGFLREYLSTTSQQEKIEAEEAQLNQDKKLKKTHKSELAELKALEEKTEEDKARINELKILIEEEDEKIKAEKKHLKRAKKAKYVKRSAIMKIIAAWVITVPAAAVLAAITFYVIKSIMN